MSQGVPTPEDVRTEFAAKYLTIRNASAAARAVGIEERTGRKLAEALDADPVFSERARVFRERALEKATDAALSLLELSVSRAHNHEPLAGQNGWSDIGSAYVRSVADLGRTVEKLERIRLERAGDIKPAGEVTINVSPTPQAAERLASG
jgi:hypothetical protein